MEAMVCSIANLVLRQSIQDRHELDYDSFAERVRQNVGMKELSGIAHRVIEVVFNSLCEYYMFGTPVMTKDVMIETHNQMVDDLHELVFLCPVSPLTKEHIIKVYRTTHAMEDIGIRMCILTCALDAIFLELDKQNNTIIRKALLAVVTQ